MKPASLLIASDPPALCTRDPGEAEFALKHDGLTLVLGALRARIRISHPDICASLLRLYADFPAEISRDAYAHIYVETKRRAAPFAWFRPQARLVSEGHEPFKPLPAEQALPLLEWGLNWAIAAHSPHYLVIHSAVIARGDRALLLPGLPGAGKSTLCAALVAAGWRLLSDEFALIDPVSLRAAPIPRPISLKNASIDIILARWPGVWHTKPVRNTGKGTVALFQPPSESVAQMHQAAAVEWIVFPRYAERVDFEFTRVSRARAFAELVDHVVNFAQLPRRQFSILDRLFGECQAAALDYTNLDRAIECMESLFDRPREWVA